VCCPSFQCNPQRFTHTFAAWKTPTQHISIICQEEHWQEYLKFVYPVYQVCLVLFNTVILLGHAYKEKSHLVILGLCGGHSVCLQNPIHCLGKWWLSVVGRWTCNVK
jgi:hypothetical protein